MSNFASPIPSVTGYDFVQAGAPTNPEMGNTWWDTDDVVGKVYTGSGWVEENAPSAGAGLSLANGQYDLIADAADVGALPDTYAAPVQSVNGQTGDVSVSSGINGIRGGKVSTGLSGDGDSATLNVGHAVPWRLYVKVYSSGSYSGKTETTATLYYEGGGSSTYTQTISGNDYGTNSNTWTAPVWSEFEQGSQIDRIECSFVQDSADSANGTVTLHYLQET